MGNVGRESLVRFDPVEGSEIRKTRPAVLVSNAAACRFDAVVWTAIETQTLARF